MKNKHPLDRRERLKLKIKHEEKKSETKSSKVRLYKEQLKVRDAEDDLRSVLRTDNLQE